MSIGVGSIVKHAVFGLGTVIHHMKFSMETYWYVKWFDYGSTHYYPDTDLQLATREDIKAAALKTLS